MPVQTEFNAKIRKLILPNTETVYMPLKKNLEIMLAGVGVDDAVLQNYFFDPCI